MKYKCNNCGVYFELNKKEGLLYDIYSGNCPFCKEYKEFLIKKKSRFKDL